MSSAYSIEFAEKLRRAYFLQKVKIANEKLQREQRRPREYFKKHFCENNYSGHNFQPFSPHAGCAKLVCRFCAEESPRRPLRASVYSYKGRSFAPKKRKTKKREKEQREKTERDEKTEQREKTESEQEWE